MGAKTVNESRIGERSGAQALALLATPLNALILRSLGDGATQQAELRRAIGQPAQSTLRAHLQGLSALETIAKRRHAGFPRQLEFELTGAGRDLLSVATALESWLTEAPGSPFELGTPAAKAAINAMAEAWSSTILRALAAGPRSLTELDRVIAFLNYPSLERRLSAMRLAGQIEASAGDGRGTPYGVTEWLRRGVRPLVAAAQWERLHAARSSARLGRIDAETIFLLAAPILRLPAPAAGRCRLAVEFADGTEPGAAGAVVEVAGGRIRSCATRLEGRVDGWASGPAPAWLTALAKGDADRLEIGGDQGLARTLIESLSGRHHPASEKV